MECPSLMEWGLDGGVYIYIYTIVCRQIKGAACGHIWHIHLLLRPQGVYCWLYDRLCISRIILPSISVIGSLQLDIPLAFGSRYIYCKLPLTSVSGSIFTIYTSLLLFTYIYMYVSACKHPSHLGMSDVQVCHQRLSSAFDLLLIFLCSLIRTLTLTPPPNNALLANM